MNTFTAIDFETAQGKRWSICQVGLVRVEKGIVTEKLCKLVCPPDNYYLHWNTKIHGLSAEDTCHAPTFPEVWKEIKPFIQGQTVVAHNGAFDFNCLGQVLDYYRLPHPQYEQRCTYRLYGQGLAVLCKEYNISLNHHDALSDAMACAELYRLHLKESKLC